MVTVTRQPVLFFIAFIRAIHPDSVSALLELQYGYEYLQSTWHLCAANVSLAEVLESSTQRMTELQLQLVAAAEKLPAGYYDPENP